MKFIVKRLNTYLEDHRRYNKESNDYTFLSEEERQYVTQIFFIDINGSTLDGNFEVLTKNFPQEIKVGDVIELTITKLETGTGITVHEKEFNLQ